MILIVGGMEDLSEPDTMALLEQGDVAHLAIISEGEPYVTPISYVLLENSLAFRTGPGRRLSAIAEGTRANVVVTNYDTATGAWESAMVWGTAEKLPEGPQREKIIGLMLEKYRGVLGSPLSFSPFAPAGGLTDVVCVAIDAMSGRSSGSGFNPRTRPGRL